MQSSSGYTAFVGERCLTSGTPWDVGVAARKAMAQADADGLLIFDDSTGQQIDLDLRGTDDEITSRLKGLAEPKAVAASRTPGRPRLGVISREVSLLPRHWDWLSHQPGGASAALRRLVDEVRMRDGDGDGVRAAQQASDRFMLAMLGNQPGYEEASRALYGGDGARFFMLSESWPVDLRNYARRLAAPAFA